MRNVDDLLGEAKEAGASDVHIAVNREPYFRIDGQLKPVVDQTLSEQEVIDMAKQLMGNYQRAQDELTHKLQTDFAYNLADGTRFRINMFRQVNGIAIALRIIPLNVPTIEELNMPTSILRFAELKQGFVICVGPTSQGKSTTLAAMLRHINEYRTEHIITIEDPIEYRFVNRKSIIDQREIGRDAPSFAEAIRATLRQDPDVILIGELRDQESMQTALTLAETGHLVLTTLHTNDSAQTMERIIDSFPPGQQAQIRAQLAATISGVISQRLLPRQDGGLIPAAEIMIASVAVRSAIREGKTHQILGMIETSSELGMQTMDSSLNSLIASGEITEAAALPYLRTQDPAFQLKEPTGKPTKKSK